MKMGKECKPAPPAQLLLDPVSCSGSPILLRGSVGNTNGWRRTWFQISILGICQGIEMKFKYLTVQFNQNMLHLLFILSLRASTISSFCRSLFLSFSKIHIYEYEMWQISPSPPPFLSPSSSSGQCATTSGPPSSALSSSSTTSALSLAGPGCSLGSRTPSQMLD